LPSGAAGVTLVPVMEQVRGRSSRFSLERAAELAKLENELTLFVGRLQHLSSVDTDLRLVTRGKRFFPSWHVWNGILSERDMIIIELSSWALRFYGAKYGGFLRTLQASTDLKALAPDWDGATDEWRSEVFARLFPHASGCLYPKPEHVGSLCDRLSARFKALHNDRNSHRAHPYDQRNAVMAKHLALEDVVEHLRTCQEVVGDLRRLSANDSFEHPEVRPDPDDSEAQSVVDLLVCRTISWIIEFGAGRMQAERPFYWQRRADFYDRMHAAHDAAGAPDAPFNDARFQPDVAGL